MAERGIGGNLECPPTTPDSSEASFVPPIYERKENNVPFLGSSAVEVLRGIEQSKGQGGIPGYTPEQLARFRSVSDRVGSRGIQALGASGYQGIQDAAQTAAAVVSGEQPGQPGRSGGSGGYAGSPAAAPSQQDWIDMIMKMTNEDRAWSAEQAQKQMDFQERMSSTAHQREVEDLQAAGLNPVLSASGGNGASTPTGAMANSDNQATRFVSDIAADAIASLGNTAVGMARAGTSTSGILATLGKIAGTTAIRALTRRAIYKLF